MQKRIKIRKTKGEFKLIDERLKMSEKSFNSFLRSEIHRLEKAYKGCPDCITQRHGGIKQERVYYIQDETYLVLKELSQKTRKPISSILNDYIINPILFPIYKEGDI